MKTLTLQKEKSAEYLSRKGQMQTLQGLGMGLVIFGVTIGIGAYVISQVHGKLDNTSQQVTGNVTTALQEMASWLGILVVAAVGGIAIWFIISYISGKRR